jgi:hypothetical protein
MARKLNTTAEVMDALGGNAAVADLTNSTYKAAANWRAFETFPARHFVVMTKALEDRGLTAPVSLWGMTEAA